jgi:DNA-binding NarL/FixJ family response regulator
LDIRVLIISPIRIYREGIADFLAKRQDIAHVDAIAPSEVFSIAIEKHIHNVILLDMSTEDACLIIRHIDVYAPEVTVVALTVSEVEEEIAAFAEAAVTGFVTRDASLEDVVRSIHAAARNELLYPKHVAEILFKKSRRQLQASLHNEATASLSKQELRILTFICKGCSNKEIARALSIEVSTVKNHVHNILRKLNVQRRGEAAALVMKNDANTSAAGHSIPGY